MFSFKWTKSESNLIIIFHTLNLPSHYEDLFQIEWQRGDHTGLTTLTFPAEDNVVVFEKRYCCEATMYLSKADGSAKPKLMTIKVWRYFQDNSKKLFGKLNLDISTFWDNTTTMPVTSTLESPHRDKSQLVFTIKFVTPNKKRRDSFTGHLTDDSITTISETMSIVTDKATEWDFSASQEGNSSIIEQFMETQHRDKQSKRVTLSDFASPSFKDMKQSRSRGLSVHKRGEGPPQIPYDRSSDTLEQFLKNRKRKYHLNQFGRYKYRCPNPMGNGDNSLSSSNEEMKDETDKVFKTPSPVKKSAISKIVLTQPASRNLMRAVLSHEWQVSPVDCRTFPKLSAVLFTLIESTQILEKIPFNDNGFSTFIAKFVDLFESGATIKNYTQLDLFVVLTHLIAILPLIISAEQSRLEDFTNKLKESARKALLNEGSLQSEIFNSIAVTLINSPSLFESVIPSFIQSYKTLKSKSHLFSSIIADLAVKHFDRDLVLKITSMPNLCTFSNAISWNSFASRISTELDIELFYLKELAQCLMMNSQLCQDPKSSKEICPHLPPVMVYELLKNQTSDEYMPVFNDTTHFKIFYQKDIDNEILDINIEINFDAILKLISIENWDCQEISDDEFKEFPFLKSNFKHKEFIPSP